MPRAQFVVLVVVVVVVVAAVAVVVVVVVQLMVQRPLLTRKMILRNSLLISMP